MDGDYKMKTPLIDSVNELYEIPISAEANQNFTTTIGGAVFEISIQTFANDKTTISIYSEGECLCYYAPITILNANLLFYSKHKGGGFFLASDDAELKNPNWQNLGAEVKLYYGYF